MKFTHLPTAAALLSFTLLSAAHASTNRTEGGAAIGNWGVETDHISTSTSPGDDFFSWVNEGWLENTEIPAGF